MTSIILRGMERRDFKISHFYFSRFKRIVPALAALCFTLITIGWFTLHPADFKTLGKHTLSSLSFSSNFIYLKESGYFDEASKEKWLLHTWSLSVEWQFYLIYPLTLVAMQRVMNLQKIRLTLILGTAMSFLLCVYASERWPSSAFYLLPTRAWEMLVGGLIFLHPRNFPKSIQMTFEATGLLLIIGSYVWLSESVTWPGYLALLPVIGTALVIAANREHSRFTGNPVSQWLGTTSYSIYLWHWPIVVGFNYLGASHDLIWITAGLITSILLGTLSYYLIENRKNTSPWGKLIFPVFGPHLGRLFAISVVISLVVFLRDGFASRLSAQYIAQTQSHVMPRRGSGYCFVDFNDDVNLVVSESGFQCPLGDRKKQATVLLFGDSYAGHYEPFWDEIGKANNIAINAVTTNWCMPISGRAYDGPTSSNAFKQCQLNRSYLSKEMGKYKTVIFAGMWSNSHKRGYLREIQAMIQETSRTVPLVIIMPPPTHYDTNVLKRYHRSLFYQLPFDLTQYPKTLDTMERKAYSMLQDGMNNLDNVIFLEHKQLFSEAGSYEKSGHTIPYSLDGMHITLEGSIAAAQKFQADGFYRAVLQKKIMGAQ